MHTQLALIGPPVFISAYRKAVRTGFPSPADDYLDAPIDLSRTLIQNAPAIFIMTVAGDSAIDAGIFDGRACRSWSPRKVCGSSVSRRAGLRRKGRSTSRSDSPNNMA